MEEQGPEAGGAEAGGAEARSSGWGAAKSGAAA